MRVIELAYEMIYAYENPHSILLSKEMRLFIRLLNQKFITLWLPDESTLSDLLLAFDQSKQSIVPSNQLEFVCNRYVIMNLNEKLDKYIHEDSGYQIHMLVRLKLSTIVSNINNDNVIISKLPIYTYFYPPNNSLQCPLTDSNIHICLLPYVYSQLKSCRDDNKLDLLNIISLIDRNGDYIPIRFELNDDLHAIYIIPTTILNSDSKYTVYMDCPKLSLVLREYFMNTSDELYDYVQWSFTTTKLLTLRLVVHAIDINADKQSTSMIYLVRQTSALFEEMKQQIASRFNIQSYQIVKMYSYFNSLNKIELVDGKDVIKLTESNTIEIHIDDDTVPPALPVLKAFTVDDLIEYNRENWVNDASGYLAISGKMSLDEENQLLLDVVNAFSLNEDNHDNIAVSNAYVKSDITANAEVVNIINKDVDNIDNSILSDVNIPVDMILLPFNDENTRPRIFDYPSSLQSLDLLQNIKLRSYAIIRLDIDIVSRINRMYDIINNFFSQRFDDKLKYSSHYYKYIGYKDVSAYHKEMLQIRRYSLLTNSYLHDLFESTFERTEQIDINNYYKLMSDICYDIIKYLLKELCGCSNEYIESLKESNVNDDSFYSQLSRSNLSAFHYYSSNSNSYTYCPNHSDITLLTIIPKGRGSEGLHIFDWVVNKWLNIEENCPDDCAIIFTGELMSKFTNNHITPCIHDVSNHNNEDFNRLSVPFQYCANDYSVIDLKQCPGVISNTDSDVNLEPTSVGLFMDDLSRRRISSNYLK